MQNRRDFLKQASLLIAGGMVMPKVLVSCSGPMGKTHKTIGLQLYSLRDMVDKEGIQKVLEAVAKMGYTHLEGASYDNGKLYGLSPVELKKRATDLGLTFTSNHLGQSYSKETDAEVMAWWDKAIDAHSELGVKYMVQPWMSVNEKSPLDDLKMYCDYFTAVGQKTAAADISFGYHNHDFEFKTIDNRLIYDFLLDNVCPEHVCFELDVYWCIKGGGDPVAYLKNRPEQFKILHIKDEKEIGASGEIDFQPIFQQMKANNVKHWYVEVEDYSLDPVASVKESYDFLNKADYVY